MSQVNNNNSWNFNKIILPALFILIFILVISILYYQSYAQDEVITVYKSPTCGCCKKWVKHLEDNGFKVKTIDTSRMSQIKDEKGIPAGARSCHTASIGKYVFEGHIPAADIKKLLAEKRPVAGLAVPGMPMGSPGMEGDHSDSYVVYEFDKQGNARVISKY